MFFNYFNLGPTASLFIIAELYGDIGFLIFKRCLLTFKKLQSYFVPTTTMCISKCIIFNVIIIIITIIIL